MPPWHQGPGRGLTAHRISRQQLLALMGLTLMWGINWPMMKIGVSALPPLYLRGITMGLASLWLLVYFKRKDILIWPTSFTEWRDICILGLPNIFLWHSLSILGIVSLPSGRASILGFMFPVWTVVLGVLFIGEALTRRVLLAVVAALYFWTSISRALLFWAAFILTRPLGATVGDFLDKPLDHGGLDLSRPLASLALGVAIAVLVWALPQRAGEHPAN